MDGDRRLLAEPGGQFDVVGREVALALRLDQHEYAERLLSEVQGDVEAGLLAPGLHGGSDLWVERLIRQHLGDDLVPLEKLPVGGPVVEWDRHAEVVVRCRCHLVERSRHEGVLVCVVVVDDALGTAERRRGLARDGPQHLVEHQRRRDRLACVEHRGQPLRAPSLVAIELRILDGEGGDASQRFGRRCVVQAESAIALLCRQLDDAGHHVSADHG